jgi:hypothetical protein
MHVVINEEPVIIGRTPAEAGWTVGIILQNGLSSEVLWLPNIEHNPPANSP